MRLLNSIAAELSKLPGVEVHLREGDKTTAVPLLQIDAAAGWAVGRFAAELRAGDPAVWLGMSLFPDREIWIDPVNLQEGEESLLVSVFENTLRRLG